MNRKILKANAVQIRVMKKSQFPRWLAVAASAIVLTGVNLHADEVINPDTYAINYTNNSRFFGPLTFTVTSGGAVVSYGNTVNSGTSGAGVLSLANTSAGNVSFELGSFLTTSGATTGTRVVRPQFLSGFSQVNYYNGFLSGGLYGWFQDGSSLGSLSGAGVSKLNIDQTAGMKPGANWLIGKVGGATLPTNFTGYPGSGAGVNEIAFEVTWNDTDNSGTRTAGDAYTIGDVIYAYGDANNTFVGWSGGAPSVTISVVPEPATLALLGLGMGTMVFLRRRK